MTTKAASAGRRQAGDETERRLNTLLANLAGMAYRLSLIHISEPTRPY